MWTLIIIVGLLIYFMGVGSNVYLGDEAYHYRLTQIIYQTGHRPVYDNLMHWTPFSRMPILTDILWHYGLALMWLCVGGVNQAAAQAYNAGFAALLIMGTYLLGKELYDYKTGILASVFVIGVPMLSALSITLHQDVAVASIAVFVLYFAYKRQYVLAGIFLGLSLLMKRSTYYVVPALFLLIMLPKTDSLLLLLKRPLSMLRKRFWKAVGPVVIVIVMALFIQSPDWYFRIKNFGTSSILPILPIPQFHVDNLSSQHHLQDKRLVGKSPELSTTTSKDQTRNSAEAEVPRNLPKTQVYDISSPISNPLAPVEFFGIPLIAAVLLYPFIKKSRKDYPILLICISGIIAYIIVGIKTWWMLRYVMILVPYFGILAARSIRCLPYRAGFLSKILLVGCILQFIVISIYVWKKRQIPAGLTNAYQYIKTNLPKEAVIMTPRTYQATLYTNRRAQWGTAYSYVDLAFLFWRSDEEGMLKIARKYGTTHFLISRDRVYDDRNRKNTHGYPLSFVIKMHKWSNVRNIYEKSGVSIWEIIPMCSK
ncbi:MAG: glycosyltransferase family 39 protein [Planctomycetes bacterium]|nr:glycosyltransferase family 39 protein [Planctomycetota bacterium]